MDLYSASADAESKPSSSEWQIVLYEKYVKVKEWLSSSFQRKCPTNWIYWLIFW